jgi:hypothetical protein
MPGAAISYHVTEDGSSVPPFVPTCFSTSNVFTHPMSMRYVRFDITCG